MTHLTADHRRTASPYDFGRLADAPPVPGDPQAIPSLTPRERQVLTLLGHAADNREISRRLGIAERTAASAAPPDLPAGQPHCAEERLTPRLSISDTIEYR
ncbi:helix-turn-helix transcriptional regulator [Streptomyces sp. NPDC085995]|uniref:helix-turn-helix domain-containing protein n=1 Tax=Streptomyces sp. NPDC085995 TaxID=3154861 RepID=UPI0034186E27